MKQPWTHSKPVWFVYGHTVVRFFHDRDEAITCLNEHGGYMTCDYGHGEIRVLP